MNLGSFIKRIKMAVPDIGQTGVTDEYITTLINQGVNEVNLLAKIYSGYTDFNLESGKRIYDLSVSVPRYLGTDKRGLFILIDGNWEKIEPKTEAYLSENFQDYLNAESVEQPNYYWVNGNELGFYPAPVDSVPSGCRLYHLMKAVNMGSDGHYPFTGSDVEIMAFIPLDDAIVEWACWRLKPSYGAVTDVDLGYRRFLEAVRKGTMQVKRRRDLMNSNQSGIRV